MDMDEFNRQRVIKNLMTLVQNSGMKVGDVEKKLGVSAGYLSRLSKKENESALSAEFIWKISQLFGVSVVTLVKEDLGQEDKMIGYMRKFIGRLTQKTLSGELEWTPITVSQINNMLMGTCKMEFPVDFYRDANFPTEEPQPSDNPIRIDYALGCYGDRKVVSAVYGGIIVNPQGSVYHTTIGDERAAKELYLACYYTEGEIEGEVFYELMLLDTDAERNFWEDNEYIKHQPIICKGEIPPYVEEVCNTFITAWQPIRNEVKDLYRTVSSHEEDIKLSISVKSTIDRFMADDIDELPF